MNTLNSWDEQSYSDLSTIKDKIDRVKQEWESFITTGKVTDNIISAEVLSSWQRCRNRNLDPHAAGGKVLSNLELQKRLEANSELIEVASPFLQAMAESVEGSGFRVDLFDGDLYLLKQFGDKKVMEESALRSQVRPGVCRGEAETGTNAINLAALLEKPVQLVGPEHYKAIMQHWTCSAVPILDEDGKVIAVINAAGYYWLMHKHTIGMIIALGKSIEYSLMQRRIRKELEQSYNFNKEIMEAITDVLVVVDTNGRISMANKAAQELLGIDADYLDDFAVDEFWGKKNPFSEVLRTGQPIVDREITFNKNGKTIRLVGAIRPITSNGPKLQGVIGILKGMQDTKGMIRNFAGWKAHYTFADLKGDSPEFRQSVRLSKETAKMKSNILLQGESGTGKELFAQAIHNASQFSEGPFVVINCAAIPNGLLESELFGYEGGAFTGAKKGGQLGKFELAEAGTIFLDEINSLPIDMQAKILRTLNNKTVIRVGGTEEIPVNVRVIAATNTDLWEMVKRGEFREDLFYRINVIAVFIPPLRERGDDLELLVQNIIHNMGLETDLVFSEQAMALLRKYHWPGNIRELENVVERSYILAKTKESKVVTSEEVVSYKGIADLLNKQYKTSLDYSKPLTDNSGLKDAEKEAISKALKDYQGNISWAAQELGIARNTLYRKIKKYGLDSKEYIN